MDGCKATHENEHSEIYRNYIKVVALRELVASVLEDLAQSETDNGIGIISKFSLLSLTQDPKHPLGRT